MRIRLIGVDWNRSYIMNTFRVTLASIWTMLVNVRHRYRLQEMLGGRKATVHRWVLHITFYLRLCGDWIIGDQTGALRWF
jgi:hypothetical protein